MTLDRQGGAPGLTVERRGRRVGSGALSARQAARMRRLVVSKMPDQLAFPFYLRTRQAAAQLITARPASRWL